MNQIISIKHNGDRRISFRFSDGFVAELDFTGYFESLKQGRVVLPLLHDDDFEQAYLDHGILTWNTGYDICPDVIRLWCEHGKILSQKETDQIFDNLSHHLV